MNLKVISLNFQILKNLTRNSLYFIPSKFRFLLIYRQVIITITITFGFSHQSTHFIILLYQIFINLKVS